MHMCLRGFTQTHTHTGAQQAMPVLNSGERAESEGCSTFEGDILEWFCILAIALLIYL